MSKITTALKLLKHDRSNFFAALLEKIGSTLPDKLYLQMIFRLKMGYKLNLKNPRSYSEKLQWLKLYHRDPVYTRLVDKFAVKKWVAERIGEEYVIPTLGIWNNANEIDFDKLPNQFVLKTTNGGGGGDVIICKDKSKLDKEKAVVHLNKGLKKDIYKKLREWPYKNVPPRVIAEKYMEDESGELRDYKFFCFNGCVKCIQVDYDRFVEHHRNIYDTEWNLLPFSIKYPSKKNVVILKPKNFDIMLTIAELLSKNIPHVRVDLYNVNGRIYFGELTFYHGSGHEIFNPKEWDYTFGEWLQLPSKYKAECAK